MGSYNTAIDMNNEDGSHFITDKKVELHSKKKNFYYVFLDGFYTLYLRNIS